MAGSLAMQTKAAIKTGLVALQASTLAGVQVGYGPPRDQKRESIWLGKVTGDQEISAGRSGTRTTRDDKFVVELHIQVRKPGVDCAEVEDRAVDIGVIVEEYLAGVGPVVSGLLDASVAAYELDSYPDDDGYTATLDYSIICTAYMT
jgi:hypothetical protein